MVEVSLVDFLIIAIGVLVILTNRKPVSCTVTITRQPQKKQEEKTPQKTGVVHLTPERESAFAKGKKESEGDY